MKTIIKSFILWLSISTAISGNLDSTQYDFWVGNWDANWDNGDGTKATGTNHVERILGGKVLQENFEFTGVPEDQKFLGKSFSVFDKRIGKWKQTWVDNSGSYLDFEGSEENGNPIFWRKYFNADGKEIWQRMVFYNIQADSFDWRWEYSIDSGKNWTANWTINYHRIKK